jgi:hypothetical protein
MKIGVPFDICGKWPSCTFFGYCCEKSKKDIDYRSSECQFFRKLQNLDNDEVFAIYENSLSEVLKEGECSDALAIIPFDRELYHYFVKTYAPERTKEPMYLRRLRRDE